MKTINFLTSHFLPENTACTNRVLSFIQKFEEIYNINVICLTEKGVIQKNTEIQYSKNIKVYYVNQKDFNGKNFIKRAFYEIYYILKLIKISNNLQSDIVMATSPYMFIIPLVGFQVSGQKILDIRDLVWEYLDEKNFIKKIIKKTLTFIMIAGTKKFDKIIVTNRYELNFLFKKYKLDNATLIPNGIDKKRYQQLSSIKSITNDIFTVTYVGNIGLAQNLKVLIDAAKELTNSKFLIIGGGIELEAIKKYAKELELKNIDFLGKIQWDELKYYYEKSSVLYAQLDEKYFSAMPSKLYEYSSIGLPIVYGGTGQAKAFVESLNNSQVIQPNNINELINALKNLRKEKRSISIHNRSIIKEKYIREEVASSAIKIVNTLIGE